MAIPVDQLRADFESVINDFPAQIRCDGKTFTGLKTNTVNTAELQMGGDLLKEALTLWIKPADLPQPVVGKTLAVDGVQKRIVGFRKSFDGVHFEIDVASPES